MKNQIFGGTGNFVSILAPYSHGTFLNSKQQGEQPLGNFLKGVPENREESIQLAHLPLPE